MDARREPRHRPDVLRVLLLAPLLFPVATHAHAQVPTDPTVPPPPGTTEEPPAATPDEFADEPALPDPASPGIDPDQEFYDFDAETPRLAPPTPPAAVAPDPELAPASATRGLVPTGDVHHVLAAHLGTMGQWADRPAPIFRVGALYLVDIRPSEDSRYRIRLGVGIHVDIAATVVLGYYARLLPIGLDLGGPIVFRLGADIGVAHLVGGDAQFMAGPITELGLALDEGHVEIAMQFGVPVLVGLGSTELWTLNLLFGYLF